MPETLAGRLLLLVLLSNVFCAAAATLFAEAEALGSVAGVKEGCVSMPPPPHPAIVQTSMPSRPGRTAPRCDEDALCAQCW